MTRMETSLETEVARVSLVNSTSPDAMMALVRGLVVLVKAERPDTPMTDRGQSVGGGRLRIRRWVDPPSLCTAVRKAVGAMPFEGASKGVQVVEQGWASNGLNAWRRRLRWAEARSGSRLCLVAPYINSFLAPFDSVLVDDSKRAWI